MQNVKSILIKYKMAIKMGSGSILNAIKWKEL